ncbi:MAG: Bifunctional protein HldE [Chlamydiae bacterium]|nr:Bifunctional protein HldE [Chlamydiota bacterium]
MVKLIGSFSRLKRAKVAVVGDFMLDTYTTGRVERISPEAPVPILHVQKSEDLPGGAGNVTANLKALGAEVIAVGRIGEDREGRRLKHLLEEEGVECAGIFTQREVETPLKNRLIAGGQQLIRIDKECITPLSAELEERVVAFIKSHIEEIEVIALSDYAKGFLTNTLLKSLIELASNHGIPTIVDPKGDDFTKYRGATLIKPNYREALIASKLSSDADLTAIGHSLLEIGAADTIMITRSEEGITLFDRDRSRCDFPVKSREVKDVTGAGDTVLAMIAMTFASQLDLREGVELSNVAAGIAIERLGCVRVSLSDIAERLLETSVINKVFDERHLFVLEQALQGKNLTILGINSNEGLSSALYTQIQKISKETESDRLMIYLSDPEEHTLSFLSSLHAVDFIVIQSESLASLSQRIHPAKVYTLDRGVLSALDHTHALFSQ